MQIEVTNRPALRQRILGGIAGLVVGDALGVPVEFQSRESLKRKPVCGMIGHGTHHQPAGTWSDDSSLALATAASLIGGYDPGDMMRRFRDWLFRGETTPWGSVFDVGGATREAIFRAEQGVPSLQCGCTEDFCNGNGSLMRILPLSLHASGEAAEVIVERSMEVSSLTHAHVRSRLCCAWFSLLACGILRDLPLPDAMSQASGLIAPQVPQGERPILQDVLDGSVVERPEREIASSGYVVHTLEAALWCCARHRDFASSVLAAVNLGGDSDTTGAVAGGLAGMLYGIDSIPRAWIETLARKDFVLQTASALADAIQSS